MSLKAIEDFEKRFEAVMYQPGLAGKFTPEEIRRYLSDVATSSLKYRWYPIYPTVFKTFPAEVWFPVIGPLLDGLQLMPQGVPYTSHDVARYETLPDGTHSKEPFNTFHPAVQLIHAALQAAPELFRDKLDLLFIHDIRLYNDTEVRFWNAYGRNFYDFFAAYVSSETLEHKLINAVVYMLMSGGEKMEALAVRTVKEKIRQPQEWPLRYALMKVGKAWTGGGFRALHSGKPLHMIFPEQYLPKRWDDSIPGMGPSAEALKSFKALAPLPHSYRFGGWKKTVAGNGKLLNLHHILTLDPIPEGLGISSVKRLELVTDLDEIIDESTDEFYHHNEQGEVMIKGDEHGQYDEDGYETPYEPQQAPFKPCSLRLSDQGERFRLQSGQFGENHYRVGGMPHFVQDYHYPNCCDCGQAMSFVLQMDSGITQEGGGDWFWGGGGMGYIFWCDACRVSSICWFSS